MTAGGLVYGPISSYSRVRILHLLFEATAAHGRAELTIEQLCDETGLHANTVREHLQRLVEGGYVIQTSEHRTTRGRPRTLYSAVTGTPEASSSVARDKVAEAARRGDMMRRILSEQDSALGHEAANQLDALIEHLEESGFEPVVDEDELTVDLAPCPHVVSRSEDRAILCQVHLGLMQGVLTQAGGPVATHCVRAAARPEDCVVQLRLTAA